MKLDFAYINLRLVYGLSAKIDSVIENAPYGAKSMEYMAFFAHRQPVTHKALL